MKVFCFIILAFLSIKKRVNSFHCKALLRIWIPPTIDSAALKISPIYPLNVNNYLPMVDGENSCQLMCTTNLRNYRYNIGFSSFTHEIFISLFLDIICRLSKIVHISRVFKSVPFQIFQLQTSLFSHRCLFLRPSPATCSYVLVSYFGLDRFACPDLI